jgi:hypothetical protein
MNEINKKVHEVEGALNRYQSFITSSGAESSATGIIIFDSVDQEVNEIVLSFLNKESKVPVLSLNEFGAMSKLKQSHVPCLLLLKKSEKLPQEVRDNFYGIFRTSEI